MKTITKNNTELERSIQEKLEFSVTDIIQKMRPVLNDKEIIIELTPHLTKEEINYIKTKL